MTTRRHKPAPRRTKVEANVVEAFVTERESRSTRRPISPELAAHLRQFADFAEAGRPVSGNAVVEFIKKHHGISIGSDRLLTMFETLGLKPWWRA